MKRTNPVSIWLLLLIIFSTVGLLVFQLLYSNNPQADFWGDTKNIGSQDVLSETMVNPDDESVGLSPNIILEQPKSGAEVSLPLVIKGMAKVFDNRLGVRVKDMEGKILVEDFIKVETGNENGYGQFLSEVVYQKPATGSGVLELFQIVPGDRSEKDNQYIPINFQSVEESEISLFFGNSQKEEKPQNCRTVYPVLRRLPKQKDIESETIRQLLKGLSYTERQEGYFTGFTPDVKLISIEVAQGVAEVRLSSGLSNALSDSCRRQILYSQLSSTLKQFKGVNSIKVFSEGQEIKL